MEYQEIDLSQIQALKEYQSEKRNRIILSNAKLNEYTLHLAKYFSIKQDTLASGQKNFIQDLVAIILDENDQLFDRKDGIYSLENIQILKITVDIKKWNKIFTQSFGVKNIRSYLYYGLLNAIVETTKTIYDIAITDDQVIFMSNDSIEKTEFGMYFYLLSVKNRYEKKLCVLDLEKFNDIIGDALKLDTKLSQNLSDVDELKRLHDYMKSGLLNRNLYVFYLFSSVIKIGINKNELFYDYNEDKLEIDSNLNKQIIQCVSSSKKYTLVPLTLSLLNEDTAHQNIILIDNQDKTAIRFEPHGSTRVKLDESMNRKLAKIFEKLGIEYQAHLCPKTDIQTFEYFVPDFLKGKCIILSMDYLKYRIDDSLDPHVAPIVYYKDIVKKGVIHWKEISEQNDQIYNKMQIYLDLINQTFKTSLTFHGAMLDF